MMRRSWLAIPIALVAVGCGGTKDPLEGKSQKDLESMQAADQKRADDEERENIKERKKANAKAKS